MLRLCSAFTLFRDPLGSPVSSQWLQLRLRKESLPGGMALWSRTGVWTRTPVEPLVGEFELAWLEFVEESFESKRFVTAPAPIGSTWQVT